MRQGQRLIGETKEVLLAYSVGFSRNRLCLIIIATPDSTGRRGMSMRLKHVIISIQQNRAQLVITEHLKPLSKSLIGAPYH